MAGEIGAGFGIDLSSFIANADKADKKLQDMVVHAQQLETSLTNALNSMKNTSALGVLNNIQSQMKAINDMKVGGNIDTASFEKLYGVIDKTVVAVQNIAKHEGVHFDLFNESELHEDNKLLFDHQNKLVEIKKRIEDLKKSYGNGIFRGKKGTMEMPAEFDVSKVTQKKDGTQIKEGTAAYSRALNAGLKAYYDTELKKLLELKAQEEAYVSWHSKTFSQQAAEAIKLAKQKATAEAKEIKSVQTEYANLGKNVISIYDQIKRQEKTISKGEKAGKDMSSDKAKLDQMTQLFTAKYAQFQQLEQQYGDILTQQKEAFWIKTNERDRRGLEESIKIYQEKQKQYLQTPEGAIAFSNSADSINQEKEAIKVLIAARDNLSQSSEKYKQTIDDLNNRIQKHRISVEQLSTAEKNETTLQPTIRNEYARLLKEIDKVIKEKEALAKTSAYQSGDAGASKHYEAMLAREQDLQRRIQEIRDNAGDLLAETERKHASDVASNFLAEVTKAEAARLEIVKQKLAEEQAERSKYGSISAASANRLVAITSNASNIQQEEEAVKKLKDARAHLNKEDADYQQTLDKLNSEIEQHEHNIKMATDATYRKQQVDKQNSTYEGAIQYAKEATTVEQYAKAIEYLEKARKKENITTAEGEKRYKELGEEITSLKNRMKELNGQQDEFKEKSSGLLNITDQLTRRFALLFSVSSVTGYIKKLSEVRGEFELQQRSLQVLLGSRKEANELWNKTAELAVRSPFRVKELVTYTKQLAAYRIEADKLYDTNKMLADISAGLGVDMDRLILAYGQVKAANFLRGTELRQFSEAGVNLLELLSEYYSTIEDKTVSVGEVFERVSKRMVSFKDVEHVLKGVTEAGGMFYKMQEKQSETLKGEISNLKDSLELMLNEIGETNEGLMKDSVAFAKTLFDNYEKLIPILKTIIALLALTKLNAVLASKSMLNLATELGVITAGSTKALKVGQLFKTLILNIGKSISGIFKMITANPWAAVITAILAIVIKIANEFRKTKKEIKEIHKEANSLREEASQIELKFNIATEKGSIDEAKEQINTLIAFAEENYSLKLAVDFSELDKIKKKEDKFKWLNDKVKALREEISRTSVFVTTFNEVLAKMGGFHIGDDMNKDAEQLSASSATLLNSFEKDANIVEAKYLELKKIGADLTDLQPIYDKIKDAQDEAFDYNKLTKYREAFDLLFKSFGTNANGISISNWLLSSAGRQGHSAREDFKKEFVLESGFIYDPKQVADAMVDYDSKMQEFLNEWDNFEAKMDVVIPPFIDEEESKKRWKSAIDKWVTDNGYNILMKQTAYSLKGIPFEEETGGNVDEDPEATREKEKEALNRLKKQIQLIREAARAYDEMRKLHNKAYADEHIQSEYKGAFKEAGLGNISNYAFGTREDELNNLNKLKSSASAVKDGMLELSKATAQVGVQVDNVDQELTDQKLFDEISKIFSNYEISLEMDKLNIPKDLASKLFGFDAIDLDDIRGKVLEEFDMGNMAGLTNEQIYDSDAYKDMSQKRRDELKKALEEEENLQNDYLQNNLKKYIEYTKKQLSAHAEIKYNEYKQLAEIEKTFAPKSEIAITDDMSAEDKAKYEAQNEQIRERNKLLAEQKVLAIEAVNAQAQNDAKQLEWDNFRSSDVYMNLFNDLDKASDEVINKAIARIEEFKKEWKDMPVQAAKEMFEKLTMLQDALADTQNVRKDKRAIEGTLDYEIDKRGIEHKSTTQKGRDELRSSLQSENVDYQAVIDYETQRASILELINSQNKEMTADDLLRLGYSQKQLEYYKIGAEELGNSVEENNKLIKSSKDNVTNAQELINNNNRIYNLIDKQEDKTAQVKEQWVECFNTSVNLLDNFKKLGDSIDAAFGTDIIDDTAETFIDMGSSMLTAVANAISLQVQLAGVEAGALAAGTAMNSMLRIIGWIVMAVQLLVSLFTAIAEIGEKNNQERRDKEIQEAEKLKNEYEDLVYQFERYEKAFNRISDAFDKAYTLEQKRAQRVAGQQNIEEQKKLLDEQERVNRERIEHLEAANAAEKELKDNKQDKDYIENNNREIAELIRQQDEIADKRKELLDAEKEWELTFMESFGGTQDYASIADEWVDAWIQAFEESGDGLEALEGKFDDFIKNLMKKQVVYKGASKIMEGLMTVVNDAIGEDGNITQSEWEKILKESEETYGDLDSFLKNYVEMLEGAGISLSDNETTLSGLQKGIQGITEDQAEILSAYWNAVRLDVSAIRRAFESYISAQSGTYVNPMLEPLKSIKDNTTNIYKLLDSVVGESSSGAGGVRVYVKNWS